jgi:hypothetical protein
LVNAASAAPLVDDGPAGKALPAERTPSPLPFEWSPGMLVGLVAGTGAFRNVGNAGAVFGWGVEVSSLAPVSAGVFTRYRELQGLW